MAVLEEPGLPWEREWLSEEPGLPWERAWRWEEPGLPWVWAWRWEEPAMLSARESPSVESGLWPAVALPSAGTLRLRLV